MTSLPAGMTADRTSRIVLFASLALNLFFLGVLGAGAVRHYWHAPRHMSVPLPPRSAAERIDRLAATLPSEDGEKLRAEMRQNDSSLEAAHTVYRSAQEATRVALRAEPFDMAALRGAMSDVRAARQRLDLALQDVIAKAAAEMSPEGRRKLAEWSPPSHPPPGPPPR
jgi:uncharacterized membrane protein